MTPEFERITADDVQVGDRIARTRTAEFHAVTHIDEGPVARRLWFQASRLISPPGQMPYTRGWDFNIRPRRTTKLWRKP